MERENTAITPIEQKTEKYNMQIDFMKNHFSGMLLVREMQDGEVRFIFDSYFGMSIFDVGLVNEKLIVHSMMDALKGERVQKFLENDFKLLFLPNRPFRKIKSTEKYIKFVSGKNFGKTEIYLYKKTEERGEYIHIEHPWLKIKLKLEKI